MAEHVQILDKLPKINPRERESNIRKRHNAIHYKLITIKQIGKLIVIRIAE